MRTPSIVALALASAAFGAAATGWVTSAIFWRMIWTAGDRRLNGMSALVLVTVVCLRGNLLAALLTLAPQPLYNPYAGNPLSDQQSAGLLMWLPAGLLYLASSFWALRSLFAEKVRTRR